MTATAQKIVNDTTETPTAGVHTGDLAKHLVDLVSEKTAFQADALVLKTGEKMVGSLLDMMDTDKHHK